MPKDAGQIITEIEELTARMIAMTCWEQTRQFAEFSASRHSLAALLLDRPDLDGSAVERIRAVIQAGHGLLAQTMAMRESVVDAIAETEKQQRLTREIGSTVAGQTRPHCLDMEV